MVIFTFCRSAQNVQMHRPDLGSASASKAPTSAQHFVGDGVVPLDDVHNFGPTQAHLAPTSAQLGSKMSHPFQSNFHPTFKVDPLLAQEAMFPLLCRRSPHLAPHLGVKLSPKGPKFVPLWTWVPTWAPAQSKIAQSCCALGAAGPKLGPTWTKFEDSMRHAENLQFCSFTAISNFSSASMGVRVKPCCPIAPGVGPTSAPDALSSLC